MYIIIICRTFHCNSSFRYVVWICVTRISGRSVDHCDALVSRRRRGVFYDLLYLSSSNVDGRRGMVRISEIRSTRKLFLRGYVAEDFIFWTVLEIVVYVAIFDVLKRAEVHYTIVLQSSNRIRVQKQVSVGLYLLPRRRATCQLTSAIHLPAPALQALVWYENASCIEDLLRHSGKRANVRNDLF